MGRRDDVIKVLGGKKPEYVPWFGDLDYWLNYLRDEKLIPEKYLTMGNYGKKSQEACMTRDYRPFTKIWALAFIYRGISLSGRFITR